MKLRTFLQQQGVSRRGLTSLIDQGKVFVNGEIVQSYAADIEEGDEVMYDGVTKCYNAPTVETNSHLLMFHKPLGYVCSKSDPHNLTIYELLPKEYKDYYYIGRLDKNSRGLVLMTNDPKLVDQYEHPRHGITKEYLVTLNKSFHKEDIDRCLAGIEDAGEMLKCVSCEIYNPTTTIVRPVTEGVYVKDASKYTASPTIRIVLNEGKKRHIRRMMSAMRYHVEDLIRIREGEFELGDLKEKERKIV